MELCIRNENGPQSPAAAQPLAGVVSAHGLFGCRGQRAYTRKRRFQCTVCRRRAFVLSSPARAAEALAFLNGQEPSNAARAEAACGLCLASARKTVGQRKQRTRRECDSRAGSLCPYFDTKGKAGSIF